MKGSARGNTVESERGKDGEKFELREIVWKKKW